MVLHCPSEVTPKVSEVICQSWPTRFCYCFSLPSMMTTTGSLFLSFQLPGLCGSGAFLFSSDNHNNRRKLEELTSASITEVYRGHRCQPSRNRAEHPTFYIFLAFPHFPQNVPHCWLYFEKQIFLQLVIIFGARNTFCA